MGTVEEAVSWYEEREALRKAVSKEKFLEIAKSVAADLNGELKKDEEESARYYADIEGVDVYSITKALNAALEKNLFMQLKPFLLENGDIGFYHKGDVLLHPVSITKSDRGCFAFFYDANCDCTSVAFFAQDLYKCPF